MNILGIQGDYTIPKGFVFAKFEGTDYFEELGDTDAVDITVEAERDERKDNRFGVSRVADDQVTGITVSLSMTLMQLKNRQRALGVMGSMGTMTQTAATAVKKTFEMPKTMMLYELGAFNVNNVVVTDGAAVDPATLVAGTDYLIDGPAGTIQFITEQLEAEVTFDNEAITSAANRLKVGIGGNPNITAEILIVGNNSNGAKVHVRLWKVRLIPSGSRGYISESERAGVEIEGSVLADQARAVLAGNGDEFAFGIEQTLAPNTAP